MEVFAIEHHHYSSSFLTYATGRAGVTGSQGRDEWITEHYCIVVRVCVRSCE